MFRIGSGLKKKYVNLFLIFLLLIGKTAQWISIDENFKNLTESNSTNMTLNNIMFKLNL